ncbi:MAG: deoxyribonuclease IV, partial [Planctomycetes bacterium]|nr:deoxyribonuclease IV [Planctomycetota bacterium]
MNTPRMGFHVSISGGLPRAIERSREREATALQIFCDNPRTWKPHPRSKEKIRQFRSDRQEADLSPLIVHASYLINPASPEPDVHRKTIDRLAYELDLSAETGADYYVLHPGSRKGQSINEGIKRTARSLVLAAEKAAKHPMILLENTAGNYGPGGDFRELQAVIEKLDAADAISETGIAVDSCHAFAAGYDFRLPEEVERLINDVDRTVGRAKLRLLHANDSRDPAGSGRDRHEHL